MPTHRATGERAWWVLATVLVAAGVLLSPMMHPAEAVLPTAIVVSAVATGVAGGLSGQFGGSWPRRVGDAARSGLFSGLAVLAMATYFSLSALGACLLFLAVAASSPPLLRQLGRWRATTFPAEPEEVVTRMSTLEIAAAWRRSFVALNQATSCQAREEITNRRQAYLDELEHRDPVALRCWLDTGARAGGDPSRFFRPQDPPSTFAS